MRDSRRGARGRDHDGERPAGAEAGRDGAEAASDRSPAMHPPDRSMEPGAAATTTARSTRTSHPPGGLPDALRGDLHRAGYYPDLVGDVLLTALGDEAVDAHLVHPETTFDRDEVHRHVTVLVLTATRLVVAHADEHPPDDQMAEPYASAATEAVPLGQVRSVVLTHVVARPEQHRSGHLPRELTMTIGWGAVSRVDLEPASCADPQCEADHGYTGSISADDITVRISAAAEGTAAVTGALRFARALSAATAG